MYTTFWSKDSVVTQNPLEGPNVHMVNILITNRFSLCKILKEWCCFWGCLGLRCSYLSWVRSPILHVKTPNPHPYWYNMVGCTGGGLLGCLCISTFFCNITDNEQGGPTANYGWRGWGADHTDQFRHRPLASPAVIVRKVVGQHLFLNIIPSNFTVGSGRKVWCDRGMSLKNYGLKFKIAWK